MTAAKEPAWARANSPEQKEQRREAILDAAAELLRDRSIADIAIGEIAERAGVAKGSVYRYFTTKEEVFLGLLVRDLDGWFQAILERLAARGRAPAREAAAIIVESLRSRERMLRLLAVLYSDIEQNLSFEAARDLKRWVLERVGAVGAAVEATLPALPAGDGGRVVLRLNALIAGLWAMSHPVGNIKKVLATARMAPLRVEFFEELESALGAMLAGMTEGAEERR